MVWIGTPESSSIEWFRYVQSKRALDVKFRESGEVYRYFDVPESVFSAFRQAASKGNFFSHHIRDAFKFERR